MNEMSWQARGRGTSSIVASRAFDREEWKDKLEVFAQWDSYGYKQKKWRKLKIYRNICLHVAYCDKNEMLSSNPQ